jgi:aminoglycoside phosphotransferase (APT) family kinase protein
VENWAQSVKTEIEFVMSGAEETNLLIDLQAQGMLPERVTHNDTKFDNVMIDDGTGEGVCH